VAFSPVKDRTSEELAREYVGWICGLSLSADFGIAGNDDEIAEFESRLEEIEEEMARRNPGIPRKDILTALWVQGAQP
jgi:hypothetical protein